MHYRDGTVVRLGDKVMFSDGSSGVVVFSIDTGEYSPEYPKEKWGFLGSGIMVKNEEMKLIHYKEADEDFESIVRVE